MKRLTTLALGMALTFTLAASGGDAKKDLDKLRGTWQGQTYEAGGNKIEGEAVKAIVAAIMIKGDAYQWKAGEEIVYQGTVKIDPTKNPKHIDFQIEMGGKQVTAWTGIYAVEGNTLKLCLGGLITARPKDFSTKGTPNTVITLKQAKK